ncbi:hypothetical protein D3C77_541590 [compost metagenome]
MLGFGKVGQQLGIDLVRFVVNTFTFLEMINPSRIAHDDFVALAVEVLCQRFVIDACRLHHDPSSLLAMLFQPAVELLEATSIIGNFAPCSVLAVRQGGGYIE